VTTKRESTRSAGDSGSNDYVIEVVDDPSTLDSSAWDGLLAEQANPTPFMTARYLAALHASRSAWPRSGWTPRFCGRAVACAPPRRPT
jgi:predicted N-acyltransferase